MLENNNSTTVDTEGGSTTTATENTDSTNGKDKHVPLTVLKKEREKRQELEKKLSEYEAAQKKAQDDELVKKGEFEKLLNSTKSEFENYKKSVEPDLAEASEYKEFKAAKRTQIKESLGDKWLESFGSLPLADLEKVAQNLLGTKQSFEGDRGTSGTAPVLTEQEKAEAANMNMTPEGYLQYKKTRESLKRK